MRYEVECRVNADSGRMLLPTHAIHDVNSLVGAMKTVRDGSLEMLRNRRNGKIVVVDNNLGGEILRVQVRGTEQGGGK